MKSVSTHSRLKAAGSFDLANFSAFTGFNTQPPEGGWKVRRYPPPWVESFNTQPPEGGWFDTSTLLSLYGLFQHTAA